VAGVVFASQSASVIADRRLDSGGARDVDVPSARSKSCDLLAAGSSENQKLDPGGLERTARATGDDRTEADMILWLGTHANACSHGKPGMAYYGATQSP